MSTGGDALRGISALLAILGGAGIVAMWGIYASIWTALGVILFLMGLFGAMMIWRQQELDGAVPVVAAAVIGYFMYPPFYMPGIYILVVIIMIVAAVLGIVAFELDR